MKKYDLHSRHDPTKNFSPLPNEVFYLGLSYGAIAVYGYLMHIEDRKTFQSYASYNTIGRAVKMSANTVRKYVLELEDKCLIRTESTTVITRDGRKRNGILVLEYGGHDLAGVRGASGDATVAAALALGGDAGVGHGFPGAALPVGGTVGLVVGAEVAGLGAEVSGDDVGGFLAGDTRQLNLHTEVLFLHHVVHFRDLPSFCPGCFLLWLHSTSFSFTCQHLFRYFYKFFC